MISGRVRPDPSLNDALRVARLRSSDGAELWKDDLRGSDSIGYNTQTYPGDSLIAIGPGDEIFVGDGLANEGTGRDFAVVKFDPETGTEAWRFIHDAGSRSADDVRSVAIGQDGKVFASGNTYGNHLGIRIMELDAVTGTMLPCQNGIDEDADGATDFPADRGCASANDAFETADCTDGIDNDGDGKIDYGAGASNDPGCASRHPSALESPQCSNGLDDDQDGAIDHPADPACAKAWGDSEVSPAPATCGLGGPETVAVLAVLARLRHKPSPRSPRRRGIAPPLRK